MLDPLVGFHNIFFFNKIHVKFHYTLEKNTKKSKYKITKKMPKKKKKPPPPLAEGQEACPQAVPSGA
jgi:hypothetical protein